MSPHQVSVIIPAHNVEAFLPEAIESALKQEGVGVEVIVVENGSTDNTWEVAKIFGDRITLLRSKTTNAQTARNQGLSAASGRYLKYLDADDRLLPRALATQLEQAAAAEQNNPNAIVYGDARLVDEQGNFMENLHFIPRKPGEDSLVHMFFSSPLTSSPLHQTALVKQVNGMDESLPRFQECDLHFRLVQTGVEMIHHPTLVYDYRQFSNGSNLMAGGATRFGTDWMFNYMSHKQQTLESNFEGSLPEPVKLDLARYYWQEGRKVFHEGYAKDSAKYFQQARSLAGAKAITGGFFYKALTIMVGPIRAENLNVFKFWRR